MPAVSSPPGQDGRSLWRCPVMPVPPLWLLLECQLEKSGTSFGIPAGYPALAICRVLQDDLDGVAAVSGLAEDGAGG
jgi:hypothetical protein